ncbi:MAG: hypothetical protein L0Y42_00665, partial [Phycisphaerales bacterium]|nr:hypothetical protein [Phycisphaerales bacterium]
MITDPIHHFLDVDDASDPAALLGLPPGRCSQAQIDAALRDRLAQIYEHPDGRSAAAERVRQALRLAAQRVNSSTAPPRKAASAPSAAPRRPAINLTSFDRLVLAVLVGCGGWNAQSRARLVSLASTYGVSVQGLIRVIHGLSEHARAGGARLGVNEITAGRPLGYGPPPRATLTAGPLLDRLAGEFATELRRDRPLTTIKLSVLFGLLTVLVFVIALRWIMAPDAPKVRRPAPPSTAQPTGAVAAPGAQPLGPSTSQTASVPDTPRVARFPTTPTFLGNALPIEAVEAADRSSAIAAEIEELSRKLAIADDQPSEAVFRQWDFAINTIATGWALAPESTLNEVDKAIAESLRAAADTPSITDRLLNAFIPPKTVGEPLDVWRGSWSAGMLGKISNASTLPKVVSQRARSQLEVVLDEKLVEPAEFETAARAWLDRQVPKLVATIELDERMDDFWELWLASHRHLGAGPQHDHSIMRAINAILATDTDLSRPGPSSNVLGRLLSTALKDPSPIVKQYVIATFDSPQITAHDLWVLTSLLSLSDQAGWFRDSLVIPVDADQRHRWRVRDDLAAAWPAVSSPTESSESLSQALRVDQDSARRWLAIGEQILKFPLERKPEALMLQLIDAARLTEAAEAIALNKLNRADEVMRQLESATYEAQQAGQKRAPGSSPPAGGGKPARIGQPIGSDGGFALAYQEAGKNNEARMAALHAMRDNSGTDLGPLDAQVFVHELYRGSPQEVRTLAQSILIEQFQTGPVVALQMVDQFADAPSTDQISQMIQEYTGAMLPETRSESWVVQARWVLVQHSLKLRPRPEVAIESLVRTLADSYARRHSLLIGQDHDPATVPAAQRAAHVLAQTWATLAATSPVLQGDPVPDDLPGIQQRL